MNWAPRRDRSYFMAERLWHCGWDIDSLTTSFFFNKEFDPGALFGSISYLEGGKIDQRGDNTLSVVVQRSRPIKLAFFGDVQMDRIENPDAVETTGLQIAALVDLTATKLKTIQQRAEAKDYVDVAAALDAGISLEEAVSAARAVYGPVFQCGDGCESVDLFRRRESSKPSFPGTRYASPGCRRYRFGTGSSPTRQTRHLQPGVGAMTYPDELRVVASRVIWCDPDRPLPQRKFSD